MFIIPNMDYLLKYFKKSVQVYITVDCWENNHKLSRNYGSNDSMLRYKHLKEHFFVDTLSDTCESKKSARGNSCAQLFVTSKDFIYAFPMKN